MRKSCSRTCSRHGHTVQPAADFWCSSQKLTSEQEGCVFWASSREPYLIIIIIRSLAASLPHKAKWVLTSFYQMLHQKTCRSGSVLLRSASSWISLHYCLLFLNLYKLFTCILGPWCKQAIIIGLNQHSHTVIGSPQLLVHNDLFSRWSRGEWRLILQYRWLNATAAGWLKWTQRNTHVSLGTLCYTKQGD